MIWESTLLMAVIDILIITATVYLLYIFVKNYGKTKQLGIVFGSGLTMFGLTVIAFFYFLDLLSMYLIPLFMPQEDAMVIMMDLHLNWSWIVMLIGVVSMAIGLSYFMTSLIPKALITSKLLEKEIEERTAQVMAVNAELEQEIEERILTESSLEESEKKLKTIADALPGVMYQYKLRDNGENQFLYFSQRAETLFETPIETILSDSNVGWELVLPEDLELLKQSISISAESLSPWSLEFRIKTPSGKIKWLLGNSIPERLDLDKSVIWNGLFFDITERKLAEHALQKSETRLQSITDVIPDVVFRFILHSDGIGEYEYISKGVETLLETPVDEALRNPYLIQNMLLPEHREKISEDIDKKVKTLMSSSHDLQIVTENGNDKWIRLTIIPENIREDNSIVWNGIIVDITAIKREEEALKFKLELQKLASTVSDHFIEESDINNAITASLMDLGTLTLSDRSSLWQLDKEKNLWSMTHEWCAKKIKPHKSMTQERALLYLEESGLLKNLQSNETYYVRDISNLSPEEMGFGVFLHKMGIESFAGFSIMEGNQLIALYSLNNPYRLRELNTQDISLLKIFGERLHSEIKRRGAEKELRENENRLKEAQRIAHLGFWELDLASGNIAWSPEQYEVWGYKDKSYIPTYDSLLENNIPESEQDYIKTTLEECIQNRAPVNFEHRIIWPNGEIRYAQANCEVLCDSNGNPVQLIGTTRDITKRKLAQIELRKSERQLKEAQRIAHLGFWEIDLIENTNIWSEEIFRIYGLDPAGPNPSYQEILLQRSSKADRELIEAAIEKSVQDKTRFDVVYSLYRPNGEIRFVHAQAEVIYDKNNIPLRMFGTLMDITESRRTEIELRKNENQLMEAQRIAHLGFWVIDLSTKQITFADELMCIFGLNPGDPTPSYDEYFRDYIPESEREFIQAEINTTVNDGVPIDIEHSIIRKDGEIRYVHVLGELKGNSDDGSLQLFGTMMDVTDRKQAEDVLRANSKFLRLLGNITTAANEAVSINDAIQTCLDEVCGFTDWPVGHAYVIAENGEDELVSTMMWHLDNPEKFAEFRKITEITNFSPGIGLPGRVLKSGEPAWIVDVTKDPNFPRAKLSNKLGVKAGFAFPVLIGANVVAVLEFFAEEEIEPSEQILKIMHQAGKQLGEVIHRKRSEEELRKSEEQFRALFESSRDAVMLVDEDSILVDCNDAALKMFGYKYVDEMRTRHTYDRSAALQANGEDSEILIKKYNNQTLKSGSIYFEWQYKRADGTEFPAEVSQSKLVLEGKIFIQSVTRDITERKRAEKALQKSEDQFRTLFESSRDAVMLLGYGNILIDCNDATLQMFGYKNIDEMRAQHTLARSRDVQASGEDTESLIKKYRNHALQTGSSFFEWQYIRSDGTEFPAEVRLSKLELEGEMFFQAVIRDITERKQAELALVKSEEQFRTVFESSRDALMINDSDGRVIDANDTALKLFGYSDINDLRATRAFERSPELQQNGEDSIKLAVQYTDGVLTEGTCFFEWTYRRADGTDFPAEVLLSKLELDGKICYESAIRDITERKLGDEALRAGEERYRTLYDENPTMFFTIDKQGTILSVNQFGAEHLGYSIEQIIGSSLFDIFYEEDADSARAYLTNCFNDPKLLGRVELRMVRKDGSVIWGRETARIVNDENDKPTALIVCEDITETRELSEQLSYQASHDALTDLINRREFERRLTRVLTSASEEASEHALCYMDLDQFKVINDTCGHVAGDELLQQLGIELQKNVRKRDTLARLGGDEFGILMEHCTLQQAKHVASKLLKSIEEYRFAWENRSFSIGASIGLVPITDTSMSTTEILKQADAACYAAKDAGRNRIHIYLETDTDLARRHGEMQWVAKINRALENNQFVLYAQPIIPIKRQKYAGEHYELLIRMQSEENELIPPGAFLPAAERYNLSPRLDRWVVDTYFSWLLENPVHLEKLSTCSINLSGLTLGDQQFLLGLEQHFKDTNIPPEKICFEITETAAIANLSKATSFIRTLKNLGCQFALDDFGSGLSSFGYLKTLPVDYLKIDGLFVKDIENDPIDLAMVKSINDIGKVMGKKTIAEFVENEAILNILKKIKVDYAQGYSVGRPKSIDELFRKKISKAVN
jgi:diguanylate cyclase (GGDEF)-like protein/PAS domain S-box-containing protein